VKCRFHDLRHSACTRMVEKGIPLPVIASLLGWSAGTTVRMAKRYGHISVDAQLAAVSILQSSVADEPSSDVPAIPTRPPTPQ
jgi:integrase